MVIAKKSLPRRTFLRGMGAAVALPFLESMAPAMTPLAQSPARPPLRFGGVYLPNGCVMDNWTPKTTDGSSGDHANPQTVGAVPQPDDRGGQPVSRRRKGIYRSRREFGRLADWRPGEADGSRRHPRGHQHRSGSRQARWPGDAVPVARIRNGGFLRLRRRMRSRVQLRVHEHDFLGLGDCGPADGDRSPRRIRAHVRSRGEPGRPTGPPEARTAAFSIRSSRKRARCGRKSAPRIASVWTTIWKMSGRSNGASRRQKLATPPRSRP